MNEQQAQMDCHNPVVDKKSAVTGKKKKASWLRTILWMFSMILLINCIMGVIAYFLFFYNK